MRKYDLIIFDMDGTILNTLEDLTDSMNVILQRHQYASRTLEEIRGFVGNGIQLLIERAVPFGLSDDEIASVYRDFMEYYQAHCAEKTRPYTGIIELLHDLKNQGLLIAVVSNKADRAVKELCERYFPGLFDVAVGERPEIAKKPAPDAVRQVMQTLGIDRDRTVYIGDSEVDVATAKNANIDGITVTWGFRTADFLKTQGATCLVNDPADLLPMLL